MTTWTMIAKWLKKWFPDESQEEDTAYNGLLSYSKEWHALAVGMGSGILSAAFWVTDSPVSSTLTMGMLVAVALGFESKARRLGLKIPEMKSVKARRSVRREPWYAIGGGIVTWVSLVLLVTLAL